MPIDLDAKLLGMNVLELAATAFGLVSVWLTVKQNVWCWPVGVFMVVLYAVVFWRAAAYANAGLQAVYFVLQFYGWRAWLRGGEGQSPLRVSRAPARVVWLLTGLGVVGTAGLTWAVAVTAGLFAAAADAAAALRPVAWLDAATTAFSLVAQWMLTRKLLQSWLFWVGVDAASVALWLYLGLYPTAALYAVFWILASVGYLEWRQSLLRDQPPPDAAPGG